MRRCLWRAGSPRIPTLAKRHGVAEAFFNPDYDTVALTHRGEPLRIVNPGYATKMFPSQ
jgi:hypothetical protein